MLPKTNKPYWFIRSANNSWIILLFLDVKKRRNEPNFIKQIYTIKPLYVHNNDGDALDFRAYNNKINQSFELKIHIQDTVHKYKSITDLCVKEFHYLLKG